LLSCVPRSVRRCALSSRAREPRLPRPCARRRPFQANQAKPAAPPPPPPPLQFDCELDASHLRELVAAYKKVYARNKLALPQDPWEQLRMGIDAVFRWGVGVG
jgi:hypothetical protein